MAIVKPASPPFPPKTAEYWLGDALVVLSSETNATPFVTAAAWGIEFAVTGKSGDDVSPSYVTRYYSVAQRDPHALGLRSRAPRQVENVVAGVAVGLMMETKAIPFASVKQELTT